MKGLLLKDLYMIKKYCKLQLLFVAFILAGSLVTTNVFFIFYPCLISGIIPVTLLSYDELSKWNEYSDALPYKKSQIVSVKYIIGMLAQILVFIISGVIQAFKMNIDGIFVLNNFLVLMATLLVISFLMPSVTLPFMFKLGAIKGRIAYIVVIFVYFAGVGVFSAYLVDGYIQIISFSGIVTIVCLAVIALYALSWRLSIAFYKKREL